jgi:hypothetical protein
MHANNMKNYIKKFFLMCLVCLGTTAAKAQLGYEYGEYDLGFAGGLNTVFGDAETKTQTKSGHINFTYNPSPFINYVLEAQTGDLKGGDALTTNTGRQFTNNYVAVFLRGQVQAGEFMDYSTSRIKNALKNLYVSTGVGYMINKMTYINRESVLIPGYTTTGLDNSNSIIIPARIGYELKIFNSYNQPLVKIDLGYQMNFAMDDNLDGFTAGLQKDKFSQITLGVKFSIGSINSYKKQIHY